MTAAIAAGRRVLPRGYADFGLQLLIWFGFLAAYQVARGVADRDPTRAFTNGWRVIGLEQRLTGLGELTLRLRNISERDVTGPLTLRVVNVSGQMGRPVFDGLGDAGIVALDDGKMQPNGPAIVRVVPFSIAGHHPPER